jgi:hypothetical protein
MTRFLVWLLTLVLGIAILCPERLGASNPQVRIQVVDEDSGSSLEQVAVSRRLMGASPEVKFRTTDGEGIANFGRWDQQDFEIAACRPDYVPSEWKRWSELTDVDQVGTRVLKLKRSTTRRSCTYGDERHRRRTEETKRSR